MIHFDNELEDYKIPLWNGERTDMLRKDFPSLEESIKVKLNNGIFINNLVDNNLISKKYEFNNISIDNFLIRLYNYYNGKGILCIILEQFLNLVSLFFLVFYSIFLIICIDYKKLFETHDIYEAIDFMRFIDLPFFIIICLVIFSIIWFFKFVKFIFSIKLLMEIRRFYIDKLGISDEIIKTIKWNEIVNKIVNYSRREKLIYDNENDLTIYGILCRIMRKDNFFIAMIDTNILDNKIYIPFIGEHNFLSKSLEWNIHKSIYNYIFDHNSQINSYITNDFDIDNLSKALKKRFIIMAWLNIIFSPFILLFQIAFFFFRFVEELKNEPTSLGLRQWSSYARWKFKQYNELPHIFDKRLKLAYKPANLYVKNFPQPIMITLSRFIIFILSSFIAVLSVFTIIDEQILFYPLTIERTVLWYLGMFGIIIGCCKYYSQPNQIFDPIDKLKNVIIYIYYSEPGWSNNEDKYKTLNEFTKLFTYKLLIVIDEIISVIVTPYLLYKLSKQSKQIILFFTNIISYDNDIGYHCSYLSKNKLSEVLSQSLKIEKSYLNFKYHYTESSNNETSIDNKYNKILNDFKNKEKPSDFNDENIPLGLSMLFLDNSDTII